MKLHRISTNSNMKHHGNLSVHPGSIGKRIAAVSLSAAMLLSLAGCDLDSGSGSSVSNSSSSPAATANADFDDFMEELFIEEISNDTLSLHFTVKDPSLYGLEDMEPSFGDLDDRDFANDDDDWADFQETYDRLTSFDYGSLDENQQFTYDILKTYMDKELAVKDCEYCGTLFGQVTGVQANMPLNMSLYDFYSADDVEDYLALLDLFDDYFDYCIDFEKYRTENGYGMSDGAIDDAVEQCNTFLEHTDDNYLITTFDNRIDAMDFTDEEKAAYKERNRDLVLNVVIPTYQTTIDELNGLKGQSEDLGGICNYPDGKEYYEYIVAEKTGSSKSIEEMQDELEQVLDDSFDMVYDVYTNAPEVYNEYYGDENFEVVGLSDATDFLEFYKEEMTGFFPTPPDVNYTISDIDSSIADNLSPAFCVTPYVDDYQDNVIQVNPDSEYSSGGLSATYAHEGYPGHLYQMTYFLSTDPYPIRDCLSFLGYDEGWAMYVELRSYNLIEYSNYDSNYVREMNIGGELENMSLCCLADIYVNYYGHSEEELADYIEDLGFNGEAAYELYDMLIEEPGYYPQYFIGYLEFVELRDYTKNALGDQFDEVGFHKVILDAGPCDFDNLRKQMDKYIDSVK